MPSRTASMRTQARWLLLHGATRTLSTLRARRGHPVGGWMFEPGARFDPYPRFEEIRAIGRIVPTPLMHATADHAIVSGALRDSQSFGVALGDAEGMPLLLRWAFRPADPDVASVVDAPSLLAVDPPTHTRY